MNEIAIVSAFFNINRSEWGNFSRSSEQYLEYFKLWAKVKNKLIVYVENETLATKIIEFREELGLKDKTIVNVISNYSEIDSQLYNSIKSATQNKLQQQYRILPKNPEAWNHDYNYIMLLKMWCVQEAIKNNQATGMVAWVDFGYNHGGDIIDSKSDFNFLWRYNFSDKIHLFSVQEIDDRPIFDIVRSMDVYIMGTIIVGVDYLWNEFWNLMRDSMISLNNCGLVDDDQTILLMAYRTKSEIFEIHKSGWMLPIKHFGGEHLIINNEVKKGIKDKLRKTPLKPIIRKIRDTKLNLKYCVKMFCNLQRVTRN